MRLFVLILFALATFIPFTLEAQSLEMTAGRSTEALSGVGGQVANKFGLDLMKKIAHCNAKKAFYAPKSDDADAEGCVKEACSCELPKPSCKTETKVIPISRDCGGKLCSCHTHGSRNDPVCKTRPCYYAAGKNHIPNEGAALNICKQKGYDSLVDYKTSTAPRGQVQCHSADGRSGCFRNAYHGNQICTQVTCSKEVCE